MGTIRQLSMEPVGHGEMHAMQPLQASALKNVVVVVMSDGVDGARGLACVAPDADFRINEVLANRAHINGRIHSGVSLRKSVS
jgi:hypothetical protein